MQTTKTLALAALAALSLGIGTALAEGETPGGVGVGPWETQQLNRILAQQAGHSRNAAVITQTPQYGASDAMSRIPYPVLEGGEGNGG